MAYQQFDGCLVHIPNKDWSGDPRERMNYEEIERWAVRLKACSTCTCSVEQWSASGTAASEDIVSIPRPEDTTVLCGTTDSSHSFIAMVHFIWQGAVTTGFRDLQLTGNGEATSFPGMTVPGATSWDGVQRLSVTNNFPSHLNTLTPKYYLTVWQNSGSSINWFVQVNEYYPCCNCDWRYPC